MLKDRRLISSNHHNRFIVSALLSKFSKEIARAGFLFSKENFVTTDEAIKASKPGELFFSASRCKLSQTVQSRAVISEQCHRQ